MKSIMISNSPFNWFAPFNELSWFEPVVYQSPVEESVHTTPFEYKIDYSVPGMRKRDLKMKVDNGRLILEGHHRESNNKLFRKNRNVLESSLYRTTTLNEDMDVDKLKAKFKDGVLSVTIPKKKEYINYREIPVSVEDVAIEDAKVEDAKVIGEKPIHSFMETAKEKILSIFRKAA